MFNTQREIRYYIDPKKHQNADFWVGDTARRTVANIGFSDNQSLDLNPKVFHQDGQRGQLQSFPCVQWRGYRNGFSLIGMGEEGTEVITNEAMRINQLLMSLTGKPVRMDVKDFSCGITESDRLFKAAVLNMVVGRDGHRVAKVWEMSEEELKERVTRSLLSNINLQAEYLGIDMPKDFMLEISSIGDRIPYMNDGDAFKTRAVVLNRAEFECNYKLQGFWSAGNFKSRGKGAILPLTPFFKKALKTKEAVNG